jgi:hypothetical protein
MGPVKLLPMLLILLCGCEQMIWYNPDVTDEQARRDWAEVKYDSVKYNNTSAANYNSGDPIADGISEGIDSAVRQNDIITAGMESKGYRLIPQSEYQKLRAEQQQSDQQQ